MRTRRWISSSMGSKEFCCHFFFNVWAEFTEVRHLLFIDGATGRQHSLKETLCCFVSDNHSHSRLDVPVETERSNSKALDIHHFKHLQHTKGRRIRLRASIYHVENMIEVVLSSADGTSGSSVEYHSRTLQIEVVKLRGVQSREAAAENDMVSICWKTAAFQKTRCLSFRSKMSTSLHE